MGTNHRFKDVIPLDKYHNELQNLIVDLEWDGDFSQADRHKQELQEIKRDIEKGNLWLALF